MPTGQGKSQGNLFFLQGQGKVREFCIMVREIRNSSKVREKSGNFNSMLCRTPQKLKRKKQIRDDDFDSFLMIIIICNLF